MTEIVLGGREAFATRPVTLPRRLPRELRERLQDEAADAFVSAARVEAAAWVASRAITQTAMLSGLEAQQVAADPMRADLYEAYVRDFALVARQSIQRLGLQP